MALATRKPTRQRRKATKRSNTVNLVVVIEKDKEGYFASCPSLQGCYTQGGSYDEVLDNIKDAIQLHLEDRKASGESIPTAEAVTLTMVEVQA